MFEDHKNSINSPHWKLKCSTNFYAHITLVEGTPENDCLFISFNLSNGYELRSKILKSQRIHMFKFHLILLYRSKVQKVYKL